MTVPRLAAQARPGQAFGRWFAVVVAAVALALVGSSRAGAQVDIAGTWSCCGSGGAGQQNFVITSGSGSLAGTATGPDGQVFAALTGSISGDDVKIVTTYGSSDPGYVATFLGTLSTAGNTMSGTWTSNIGQSGTWTATLIAAPPPPPPVLGKTADVTPVSGVVFIRLPGRHSSPAIDPAVDALAKGQGFVPLTQARQLPFGSLIDARAGTLQLVVASTRRGHMQQARLSGAVFSLTQTVAASQKGLTTFALKESAFRGAPSYASCGSAAAIVGSTPAARSARLSPRVLQTLQARDNGGSFRTRGRYSAATVRGTVWNTVDRCDGTLTVVKRGTVSVRDFARRKTILVHAGHSYLAKAP